MRNFQGIVFIWTQTYREIFKSAVYDLEACNFIKDTHREKVPSNKTPALTKSTTMGILVVGTSNQVFIRGF